jgi:hypothetical protein
VSTRTVERAAERMAKAGELVIEEGGFPRRTRWRLASRDTSGPTVATTPFHTDVVTEETSMNTGVRSDDTSSGDTHGNGVVGTGGTPKTLDELERHLTQNGSVADATDPEEIRRRVDHLERILREDEEGAA